MLVTDVFFRFISAVQKIWEITVGEIQIWRNWKYLVNVVGSEALYKRVDQKLKNLEIDQFFYREQVIIFHARLYHLLIDLQLQDIYGWALNDKMLQLFTMITQNYDDTLLKINRNRSMNFDLTLDLENNQINHREIGRKTWINFVAPLSIVCTLKNHLEHTNDNSKCKVCRKRVEKEKEKQWLNHFIKKYPELASNAGLMIHANAFYYEDPKVPKVYLKSLKELSIRQVLVLGLEQDSLPLSLKQHMMRGPEPRSLNAKEERVVEQLQELVKKI